jgi:hypothetical protein
MRHSIFYLLSSVAAVSEIAIEFVVIASFESHADGVPKSLFGSRRKRTQDRFDLGEELLDRIEIGTVGRRLENRCASCLIELPFSTTSTSRSLKSNDKGAVIVLTPLSQPILSNQRNRLHAIGKCSWPLI